MASSKSTPQLSTATSSPPATGLVSPADEGLANKSAATVAEVEDDAEDDAPEAKSFDPDFVAQETTEVRPSRSSSLRLPRCLPASICPAHAASDPAPTPTRSRLWSPDHRRPWSVC